MKLEFNYGSKVMTLPAAAAAAAGCAGKRELKLLLLLASQSNILDNFDSYRSNIAKQLGCSASEVDGALAFWRGAGVITDDTFAQKAEGEPLAAEVKATPKLTRDDTPVYSGEEMEALLSKNGNSLKNLIEECQVMAEKVFNPTEIGKIIGMSDYLRLEHEHILMLFSYCCARDKRSVAYVEKMAYSLYNEGITTVAALDAYLREREIRESVSGKLRKLFGIGDRAFSRKENNYIKTWVTDWNFGYEMIELGYEITVNNTKEFSIDYLNKVLSNWHDEGYTTTDAVEVALAAYKRKKEDSGSGKTSDKGSFDTNDFFEKALKRSYDAASKRRAQ